MKCPKCGGRTIVYDKRWWNITDICGVDVRRRKCVDCGCRYVTEERFIKYSEGRTRGERLL